MFTMLIAVLTKDYTYFVSSDDGPYGDGTSIGNPF